MIDPKTAKTFVIDTNVLLHNPNALFAFADNHVVIPMTVLEELDKFKTANNELGSSSREVARKLDRLRQQGSLREGIPTPQGGLIQVIIAYDELAGMLPGVNDHRILGCAQMLKREGKNVFFISKDINARVKADALGIPSEDFENQKVNIDELYDGWVRLERDAKRIKELSTVETIAPAALDAGLVDKLNANQFVLVQEGDDEDLSVLFTYDAGEKTLRRLDDDPPQLFGVAPRSQEQRMAFELLLDDKIKLVTLVGQAGTGKTLLALACGLAKVIHDEKFKKLLVSRPIMPLGQDIGYLPGTKDEKLSHWMGPIFDNLHFLLASEERDPDEVIKRLIQEESITLEALTYIRGRSISKQYLIVDEAQNLTPHEIKTIISRAGQDTKVVLTGDPYQIDNPYLDASSNGLTYVVERMRGQELAGHVTLKKSERSELAGIAAALL
ncbi:MAG TPA: PhoH family protein [Planctomycetota bacterium]|nr:PhoH family protein [Planctomycetota bacterium]